MKKHILTLALTTLLSTAASAEIVKITLTDGSSQTYKVEEVQEITFEEESMASEYAGSYKGGNSVVVGGMFTYSADGVTYVITANGDGTVNLQVPEYKLTGTVMGDLTLGAYTISNIPFDETNNGFYRDYASADGTDGLKMHFTAVQNGNTTMNSDYEFKNPSNVLIEKTADGLKITNSFIMGSMPFPIVATFTQSVE